jgi:hypothetical protein
MLRRVQLVFKNSVCFTITKISWLILFKEIIAVYCENYTKFINTLRGKKYRDTEC